MGHRTRRGGGGVERGGDVRGAWGGHGRFDQGNRTRATQASPPPIHTTPAPTGTMPHPKRFHQKYLPLWLPTIPVVSFTLPLPFALPPTSDHKGPHPTSSPLPPLRETPAFLVFLVISP